MARTRGGSVDRSANEVNKNIEDVNITLYSLQVRRKTSGGTVDEENFISQFSVTAGVPVILNTKMMDQEMAGVYTRLTSTDWGLRVTAFQSLRGIILASSGSYTDTLLERLKLLETGISDSLRDTRSAVVREAAVTIAFIAQQHQYQVGRLTLVWRIFCQFIYRHKVSENLEIAPEYNEACCEVSREPSQTIVMHENRNKMSKYSNILCFS